MSHCHSTLINRRVQEFFIGMQNRMSQTMYAKNCIEKKSIIQLLLYRKRFDGNSKKTYYTINY